MNRVISVSIACCILISASSIVRAQDVAKIGQCSGGCCWVGGARICEKTAPEKFSADYLLDSKNFSGLETAIRNLEPNEKK